MGTKYFCDKCKEIVKSKDNLYWINTGANMEYCNICNKCHKLWIKLAKKFMKNEK